jgi:hypothetical protein
MSTTQYRILDQTGQQREDGQADVRVDAGALVLKPLTGSVLHVPFGKISSVTEPEPFIVRVTLTDGNAVELSRLGVMRTQLLAELRDGRGDATASAAGALGQPEVFEAQINSAPAEIRVYDDALLVIGPEGGERVSFSFIDAVQANDYIITVAVAGRAELTLSRLGRRTDELATLLTERLRQARGRTAAFLASLLPGLDPMTLREAAGLLRDGVAAPARTLDALHPDLTATLIQIAALPARRDAITDLARRTELALGFKQLASVRRPATGVTPWQDHAAAPHIGQHDSPGGSFRPGLPGMMAASVMSGVQTGPFGFGEGYGAYGDYWAFRALGAGMNPRQQQEMAPRPDLTRGRLTPATEDPGALTATGNNPTVLAFALASRPGRVIYEILNQPEPMTFVYQADSPAAVNRALDDAGFQPAALHPESQIPHDAHWTDRLTS